LPRRRMCARVFFALRKRAAFFLSISVSLFF
jgi:hypothetical protein